MRHALLAVPLLLLFNRDALAEEPGHAYRPRPTELWLGLGAGDALCDNKKPNSDCPVAGGSAFALGGGYRLHPQWTVGLELAIWNFKVNKGWKGTLPDPATEVTFRSSYLSLIGRYHWLVRPTFDGYLQAGLGVGAIEGHAKNAGGTYDIQAKGVAYSLGVGGDWHLGSHFRLGPQALIYLHKSNEVCETQTGQKETCRGAGSDSNALPWRLMLVGTVLLGG